MDSDRFIQDILARPEIWMARHPHHRNKLRIKKQWIDLKNNYPQFTVDDLKKRWKNLRDTYRKELKRLPQARPGVPADNFRSNWKYFDALGFLRDEVSLPSNEPVEETTENDAHLPPERDPPQGTASPASSKSEDDMPEMPAPSTSKRRDPKELREEFLKIERKKLRILEEEVASSHKYMKSDNYHFLMSLLPEMDKLPPLQKMRLRTKISQAVLDEVSLAPYEDQQQQPYTDEQIHYTEATMEAIDQIDIKEESINMYD